MFSLIEMLKYKRPEGSITQMDFCIRFLEPSFGLPDIHGNYVKIVNNNGKQPNICFMAHHDTVHKKEGMQKVRVKNDKAYIHSTKVSSCLGADCTTGVWLILNMIEHNIPGVYVIHSGEESGCIGSSALVKDKPDWLDHIEGAISFDRYGTKSIVTHQMGVRTASDTFAKCLADVLGMPKLKADSGGSFTDSNEYKDIVSECTNISVGYYNQHTQSESQDLLYADELCNALVNADWSKLTFHRDPSVYEYDRYRWGFNRYDYMDNYYDGFNLGYDKDDARDLFDIVCDYPEEIVEILQSYGITANQLREDLNLYDNGYINNYLSKTGG